MSFSIASDTSKVGQPFTSTRADQPSSASSIEPASSAKKVVDAAKIVFQAEKSNYQKTGNFFNRSKTVIFVGGDLFTASYLLFQAIQPFIHALKTGVGAVAASYVSLSCGIIGGALTAVTGGFDVKEGIKILIKCCNDHKTTKQWNKEELFLGLRLLLCGISEILLGALLIAAPIIAKFAATSTIGVLLATNPWILVLLFAIPSFIFLVELLPKIKNLCSGETFAQKVKTYLDEYSKNTNPKTKLETLRGKIKAEILNSLQLDDEKKRKARLEEKDKAIEKIVQDSSLSDITKADRRRAHDKIFTATDDELDAWIEEKLIMSTLRGSIGIEGALAVHSILYPSAEFNETKAVAELTKKANEWITVQWIKIAIQSAYLLSFIISMGTISLGTDSFDASIANSVTNAGLAFANSLPLYLDSCKRFLRNTPDTPDELTLVDIAEKVVTEEEPKPAQS